MSDTQHTPVPWESYCNDASDLIAICSDGRAIIEPATEVRGDSGCLQVVLSSEAKALGNIDQHEEDIAFLLRAVNSHDELLAACKDLKDDHLALLSAIGEQTGSNKMSHTFSEALKHGALQKAEAAIAKTEERPCPAE